MSLRRRIRHLALALVTAVVLPLAVAPASPAAAEAPWFTIHSRLNDKCLEVQVPSGNGQRANMWDCWGGWNQQWRWEGNQLINRSTGKCLEILNVDPGDGAYVGQWDCWNGPNQRWARGSQIWGGYELVSFLNGKCLEIRDSYPYNGAYVGMWQCWRGSATAWLEVS
jgi:hypothetical protein